MPTNREKKIKKNLKIVILVIIGIVAFSVSMLMNVVGMKQSINREPNMTGMVGLSTPKDTSNKETKVDKGEEIAEQDILVNSLPIIKLNNNNWDFTKSNFSGFEKGENGAMIFEDGYTIYCNGRSAYNVIFNSNYKGELLGYLTFGNDFETIEKTLGTPTFKTENYIGYKTKEIYIFFYDDEVSVYPNRKVSNSKIEEFLTSYLEKSYQKDRTYFLVDLRNNYEDFFVDIDEENNVVTIKSLLRQVIAKLDSLGNIEIEFYNGYTVALEKTKQYINDKTYKTNENDLVEIFENERKSSL